MKRTIRIPVLFTPAEAAEARRLAHAGGHTVASLVRHLLAVQAIKQEVARG